MRSIVRAKSRGDFPSEFFPLRLVVLGVAFELGVFVKCSKCGSEVTPGAKFCGNCAAPVAQPATNQPAGTAEIVGGCLGLSVFIAVVYGLLSMCSGPSKTPEEIKAEQAKAAADEHAGFNCLSGWDGSNASLVKQIKDQLRDPDSFEHDETRITPENNGKHMVSMRYRARNGFGGMNVATAIAEVDHNTCEATLISTGE